MSKIRRWVSFGCITHQPTRNLPNITAQNLNIQWLKISENNLLYCKFLCYHVIIIIISTKISITKLHPPS
ncbi:hypothetical protein EJK55_0864 [Moraxella catarrhalis]|uniref:Uncharacterized protein n=1 Tax=Moraxella catarrhalis TaxID=480 RepID=A0ABY0BK29_MORCA|nr:hypothetical protein EJK55_0864 [Moraxella catarrhalis]RUO16001.1 hypothetical protein EJK54_0823 [Moraxella catarrhalis]